MPSDSTEQPSRGRQDILTMDPCELRDRIRLTIDPELVDELDRRRGGVPRSEYAEIELVAARRRVGSARLTGQLWRWIRRVTRPQRR